MTYNAYRCKMDITLCTADSKEIHYKEGTLIWYTRFNLNGTLYIRICSECGVSDFPDFNIEDLVEPLEGVEKELADIFITTVEQTNKVVESFNPVSATKEQKERLEKLCEGLVKVEPTSIQKMSDNELCRKLDIARRNVEKWLKREKDIQRERSRRYCYWKSQQDTEW